MGLREVFAVRVLAFDEVGNGVYAKAIDTLVQPKLHDRDDFVPDTRVIEVQVGLMAEEAMPIIEPWPPGPMTSSTVPCR